MKEAGAPSIGLTLYPPYPNGYFVNKIMNPEYSYQNGGDWTWFGARTIQQLIKYKKSGFQKATTILFLDSALKADSCASQWISSKVRSVQPCFDFKYVIKLVRCRAMDIVEYRLVVIVDPSCNNLIE